MQNFRLRLRGKIFKRSGPLFIAGIGTLSSALIALAIVRHDRNSSLERTKLAAESVRNEILHRIGSRVESLQYVSDLWKRSTPPTRAEFDSLVKIYGGPYSGYLLINWLDPSSAIRWAGPGRHGQAVIGAKMTEKVRKETWEKARDTRETLVSPIVDLFLGGKGFLVFVPIYKGNNFKGEIQGVFRVRELLETILPGGSDAGDTYTISVAGEQIYRQGSNDQMASSSEVVVPFDLYGAPWTIHAGGRRATFFSATAIPLGIRLWDCFEPSFSEIVLSLSKNQSSVGADPASAYLAERA